MLNGTHSHLATTSVMLLSGRREQRLMIPVYFLAYLFHCIFLEYFLNLETKYSKAN